MRFWIEGFSWSQVVHQEAQKLTKTTFPLRSESFQVLPSVSLSSKAGASRPTAVFGEERSWPVERRMTAARPHTRRPTSMRALFFIGSCFFLRGDDAGQSVADLPHPLESVDRDQHRVFGGHKNRVVFLEDDSYNGDLLERALEDLLGERVL